MSKNKRIKKKINAFISQLSPDEVREQLALAYLQMERCQQVLRGKAVAPVAMKDNGLSSDLELFYLCKKVAEELSASKRECDIIASFAALTAKDVRVEPENPHALMAELDEFRVRPFVSQIIISNETRKKY